ncbi:hypothetical protein CFB3_12390 [Clostridium folliculivorans]|uniref:Uncharacterized protein n=1 Tax=Clostridium folliculivorans TaxID=2886038 RepID=A0A9W5Y5M8_9CLOT|nr:hypothetical protein CFOLD11_38520 [Clostridium folliculivorans]GKU29133.1 hypothetical protein CFB3_12390 [Clostridium folliculivorans]
MAEEIFVFKSVIVATESIEPYTFKVKRAIKKRENIESFRKFDFKPFVIIKKHLLIFDKYLLNK